MTDISAAMAETARRIDATLDRLLPRPSGRAEDTLFAAMRYAVLDGGKRFRPLLTLACAKLFAVSDEYALRVAAAIELVHC